MKRKCDICGLEGDAHWMMSFNPGTGTKWFCWDCYKTAQREAGLSDRHRHQKLYKIKQYKKRHIHKHRIQYTGSG